MTHGAWALLVGIAAYLLFMSVVWTLLYAHGEREKEAEQIPVEVEG